MNLNDFAETPEAALVRLVDVNGWDWRTVTKVINRHYHTDYSISQLKSLYKSVKSGTRRDTFDEKN